MNVWDRLAELKIAEAEREGQFESLPGFGQPIADIDEGWDETRWLREKLKSEDLCVMPPAWAIRQWACEETAKLRDIEDESDLRERIEVFNTELAQRMRNALWGPPVDVAPIHVEIFIASRCARESASALSAEVF